MLKPRNKVKIKKLKVLDAYFATETTKKEYETKTIVHIVGTTSKASSLSSIAKAYKGVSWKDIQKENKMKTTVIHPKQVLNITTKVAKKGEKVTFTRLKNANLGDEVYVIVKTLKFEDKPILINIRQGKAKGIVEKDKAIQIIQNDKETVLIETTVGKFAKDDKVSNKDDFKDWAIAKVKLAPKTEKTLKTYTDTLKKLTDKKTLLYLLIDAHSKSGIRPVYNGLNPDKEGKPDERTTPNYWLDMDGKWFEVRGVRKLNLNKKGFSNNSNVTIDHIPALEKGRPSMSDNILAIILHRTVSSNYPGSWMKLKTKIKGAHFYIDKDGTAYQTASLNTSVAHIYASSSKQMYSDYYGKFQNSNTIGIEVVGNYIDNKWESLTKKQVEAVSLLVAQIKGEYNLNNKDIYPHEKVQRKTKGEGKTVLDAIDVNF